MVHKDGRYFDIDAEIIEKVRQTLVLVKIGLKRGEGVYRRFQPLDLDPAEKYILIWRRVLLGGGKCNYPLEIHVYLEGALTYESEVQMLLPTQVGIFW